MVLCAQSKIHLPSLSIMLMTVVFGAMLPIPNILLVNCNESVTVSVSSIKPSLMSVTLMHCSGILAVSTSRCADALVSTPMISFK